MKEEVEIWKDIPGYEGLYQVSNLGRVKSLGRILNNGRGQYSIKEAILKQNPNEKGYLMVCLTDRGKKTHKVHRLVAQSFIKHPGGKCEVNHIDGSKLNNKACNLEWVTHRENMQHSFAKLNHKVLRGQESHLSKSVYQISLSDKLLNEFSSVGEASRKLGLGRANISACCNGRRTTAGGYKWKFKQQNQC